MAARRLERALDAALAEVPARRHIQSLIVARGGQIQIERYFRDRRLGDLTNIHSVTKSVLATLTGIAIGDGYIALDTTLSDVLSNHPFDDERKRAITVEHLLTMTSGLDAATPHDIDEIADRGESWVDGPLAAPLRTEPGTTFTYNNGAAHVLGAVISRATEMPLRQFAEEHLFEPLEIDTYRWPDDPDGNPLGYGHLEYGRAISCGSDSSTSIRSGTDRPSWFRRGMSMRQSCLRTTAVRPRECRTATSGGSRKTPATARSLPAASAGSTSLSSLTSSSLS